MLHNELIDKSEWVYHDENSFLLIHKNASKTVVKSIDHCSSVSNRGVGPNPKSKIKWTVIREPMDRMVSGLAFDIKRNPYTDDNEIISNIENSLFGIPSVWGRSCINRENHTYTQSSYLINNPIDCYVHIDDLNKFLKINFDYDGESGIDEDGSREYKGKARELIHKFGEPRINDLHAFDNYIYQKIMSSGNLWKWQHGKVFL